MEQAGPTGSSVDSQTSGHGRTSLQNMLANLLVFAFAVGLVVAYVAVAIKTVNESES